MSNVNQANLATVVDSINASLNANMEKFLIAKRVALQLGETSHLVITLMREDVFTSKDLELISDTFNEIKSAMGPENEYTFCISGAIIELLIRRLRQLTSYEYSSSHASPYLDVDTYLASYWNDFIHSEDKAFQGPKTLLEESPDLAKQVGIPANNLIANVFSACKGLGFEITHFQDTEGFREDIAKKFAAKHNLDLEAVRDKLVAKAHFGENGLQMVSWDNRDLGNVFHPWLPTPSESELSPSLSRREDLADLSKNVSVDLEITPGMHQHALKGIMQSQQLNLQHIGRLETKDVTVEDPERRALAEELIKSREASKGIWFACHDEYR